MTSPKTITLPVPKTSERHPVKRAPIHGKAEIALALRGESANRGAIEGEIVPALDQELFIVVQHVQTAFEVAEHDGDGLDALLVRQILQAFFLKLMNGHAAMSLLLGVQVQFFQFRVGKGEEILKFVRHFVDP